MIQVILNVYALIHVLEKNNVRDAMNKDERSQENHHIESDEDDNDDEWNEMDDEIEPDQCLFCECTSNSIEIAIQHLHDKHNFDVGFIKQKFLMDQYSYIKVN